MYLWWIPNDKTQNLCFLMPVKVKSDTCLCITGELSRTGSGWAGTSHAESCLSHRIHDGLSSNTRCLYIHFYLGTSITSRPLPEPGFFLDQPSFSLTDAPWNTSGRTCIPSAQTTRTAAGLPHHVSWFLYNPTFLIPPHKQIQRAIIDPFSAQRGRSDPLAEPGDASPATSPTHLTRPWNFTQSWTAFTGTRGGSQVPGFVALNL